MNRPPHKLRGLFVIKFHFLLCVIRRALWAGLVCTSSIITSRMSLRRLLAPLSITLLAAFLRIYRLADFYTNLDHAYPLAQAIAGLRSGHWPVLGQDTSLFFANPPGITYVIALPWAVFNQTWGAQYCVICLNLLAIPLTYRIVLRLCGRPAGLTAALLIAINPWVVYYSQGTWVQSLLPLLTTLTYALMIRAPLVASTRQARAVFAALAALTVLTQMYLLAFLTTLQVGFIALINLRRVAWRNWIAGFAVFAAVTGLYIYQVVANWHSQSARLERFLEAGAAWQIQATALEHAARYVTGRDFEIAYGNDGSSAWLTRRVLSLVISLALTVVVALGVGRAAWRIVCRTPDSLTWLGTLGWWLIPVGLMTVTRQPVHIVYLLLSLPAGFVLSAPVLAPLTQKRFGVLVALVLAANSFLLLEAGRQEVAARPAGLDLDRLSLRAIIPFQQTAARLADQYQPEFYASVNSESLSAEVGRDLNVVSWYQLPEFEILPLDHAALYVRLEHGGPAAALPFAKRVARLDYPGGDVITFDLIPAYTRSQLSRLPQNSIEWPTLEGLTLVGYDLAPNGRELTCYWVIDSLSEARLDWLYVPYAHLTNSHGEMVANIGAPGIPGQYYRTGDVYIYRMALPALPPGIYQLELGLFDNIHSGLGLTFQPPGEVPRRTYTISVTLP